MCCCIPLRQLCLFASLIHIGVGVIFVVFVFKVLHASIGIYAKHVEENYNNHRTSNNHYYHEPVELMYGALISLYFLLFLPLGIILFTAVYKRLKALMKWGGIILFLVQAFGTFIQAYYGSLVKIWEWEIFSNANAKESPTTELIVHGILIMIYLFTIFFYYREIEEPSTRHPRVSLGQPFEYTNVIVYQPSRENAYQDQILSNRAFATTLLDY